MIGAGLSMRDVICVYAAPGTDCPLFEQHSAIVCPSNDTP